MKACFNKSFSCKCMTISDISIPMEIMEGQELNLGCKSASMGSQCALKVSKLIWTKGLKKKFLKAIAKLGIDNATPKKILDVMNVEGLTRDQVSSHLQKHRNLLKKIANANGGLQANPKLSLLESSMIYGASSNISSSMIKQEQMNPPSYRTSSYCYPIPEAGNFNITFSSPSTFSGTLPYEGYSMQTMTNNLDGQRNLMHDTTNMGVVNSMNSGFVHDVHGFNYNYVGCSPQMHPYKNFEMGSSSGEHWSRELAMSSDQKNATKVGNLSNSSFVENYNNNGKKISSQSEFVEMGSVYGSDWNVNLENGIGEDDLAWTETDINSLISLANENNHPVTLQPQNQEMNNGVNFPNVVSYDSNLNEETISTNQHQTLVGCLPGFDSTSNMQSNEQLMEPIWSPGLFVDDMAHQDLILNSYVQD